MSGTGEATKVIEGQMALAHSRSRRTERAPAGRVRSVGPLLVFGRCHRLLGDCVANTLTNSGLTIERLETTRSGVILRAAPHHTVILIDSAVLDDFADCDLVESFHEFGVSVLVLSTDPARSTGSGQHRDADEVVAATEELGTLVAAVHRLLEAAHIQRNCRCGATAAAHRTSSDDPLASLSPREQAVLDSMMRGLSADEIAEAQFVAVSTVRSQIRAVLTKLNVRSQLAAVALAHEAGRNADAAKIHQI